MNTSTCLQQNLILPHTDTLCSFPDCPIVRQRDSVIDRLTTEIEQLQREKKQLAENHDRLKALLNKRNIYIPHPSHKDLNNYSSSSSTIMSISLNKVLIRNQDKTLFLMLKICHGMGVFPNNVYVKHPFYV